MIDHSGSPLPIRYSRDKSPHPNHGNVFSLKSGENGRERGEVEGVTLLCLSSKNGLQPNNIWCFYWFKETVNTKTVIGLTCKTVNVY